MAEVGKEDFKRALSESGEWGMSDHAETIEAALDQAIAACDVDVDVDRIMMLVRGEIDCPIGDVSNTSVTVCETIKILARLGLLRTPATGGWQDMAKLPDNQRVLILTRSGNIAIAQRHVTEEKNYGIRGDCHGIYDHPKGWQPLPAAPQPTDGGRDAG